MGKMTISAIDLFCGIGGLTYGMAKSGIEVKAGIDLDSSCEYAYTANNEAEFIGADISEVEGATLMNEYWQDTEVRILVGCAPCQPFSSHANKLNEITKQADKKWNLLVEFTRLIKETRPQIISMENVSNLSNKNVFRDFIQSLDEMGYHYSYQNVYCPDYGIPQKRRRLVLLASIYGDIQLIPTSRKPEKYKTTKQTIGRLEALKNGERSSRDPLHFTTTLTEINLERIRASKPNGTWLDWNEALRLPCHRRNSGRTYQSVYGRMSWDEPSPTITTQFYNYGTGRFGHPEQDRPITVREAALLQTFPKKYSFYRDASKLNLKQIGMHIGNAVPVELGTVIGRSILKHLNELNTQ